MEDLTFEQIISSAIRQIPTEDPTEFIKDMYRTISKPAIDYFISEGKKKLQYEHNKNGKPVNCYLALGSDGNTRSLFTGMICGMLWLQDYLQDICELEKISKQDLAITNKVLNAAMIPTCFDAHFDDTDGEIKKS